MSSPILPSPIMTSSNQDDEHRPASPPIVPTPLVIGGSNIPDLPINPTPQSPHVKPRALIVVGDGSEEMEVLTLSDLLALGGMHVTLAALGRNPSNVVEGNFGLRIRTDQSIEDSSFGTYELIVIPGGDGVERYLECELLKKMLQWHTQDNRWVAASSSAPARVLRPLNLLERDMQATCSADCARFISNYYVNSKVVVSGRVVTSQGPGTAIALGLTLIQQLCDEQKARSVAQQICYQWS